MQLRRRARRRRNGVQAQEDALSRTGYPRVCGRDQGAVDHREAIDAGGRSARRCPQLDFCRAG